MEIIVLVQQWTFIWCCVGEFRRVDMWLAVAKCLFLPFSHCFLALPLYQWYQV